MSLSKLMAWLKWLLEYNLLKYIGISIMTAGPLFLIYLHLFNGLLLWMTFFGSFILLFTGFIVWLNGWDPYETIIKGRSANDFLRSMKGIFGFLEWYKWLLAFSIPKYFALFLMMIGPLFFIYMSIFRGFDLDMTILYSISSFIIGTILWIINWDPYS